MLAQMYVHALKLVSHSQLVPLCHIMLEFISSLNHFTACDTIIQTKATTRRARKPKARSKEAIIKKLKYAINCPELGLASLPPTDIVYANEVWVYNTKTRKIGVYKALNVDPRNMQRPGTGIMIKGTTLQDFCTESSTQKTLRKPVEMIKNFDAGKMKCSVDQYLFFSKRQRTRKNIELLMELIKRV